MIQSVFFKSIVPLLVCLLLFFTLAACSTNKATGRSQPNVLSPQEERDIGATEAPKLVKQLGGEIPSDEIRTYVTDLGNRLAAVSEEPELPWEFFVVNDNIVNAFALPGGKVFVTRGMLQQLTNEAQLAGILGHEIGHVTARHLNDRLFQHLLVTGAAIGLGVAGGVNDDQTLEWMGVGVGVGGNLTVLAFSRGHELEADRLGLRYMTRIGYNPYAQVQVMEILRREAAAGMGIEFLQTHPIPNTRIKELTGYIRKDYPDYDTPGRYIYAQKNYQISVLNELAKLPDAKLPAKK
ncbi:TPR repeat-containing protein YfgC precursor [Poriferisphaera corsica]|uniref:TPR repeat-containing protein YfgC n=1 Tax=Poriferisphaera corsica TaxID=2528020 RepID=A0A517YUX6_9BACT|nr:M48 family metallopeptidase [Poriferisphaera corsica]QDU34027.1 TPR repeat-containing protein YfgC precursor [Poriferisphaera corsica]